MNACISSGVCCCFSLSFSTLLIFVSISVDGTHELLLFHDNASNRWINKKEIEEAQREKLFHFIVSRLKTRNTFRQRLLPCCYNSNAIQLGYIVKANGYEFKFMDAVYIEYYSPASSMLDCVKDTYVSLFFFFLINMFDNIFCDWRISGKISVYFLCW